MALPRLGTRRKRFIALSSVRIDSGNRLCRIHVPELLTSRILLTSLATLQFTLYVFRANKTIVPILNPGNLKLSVEEIYEGGNSKARNPRMQDMLRMIGFGENLGSGFPKIIDAWKDAKWSAPTLEDHLSLNEVRLTLPIPFAQESTQETTESTQESTQERILAEIRRCPSITRAQLSTIIGISPDGVKKQLDKLKRAGVIEHVGATKKGEWRIIPGNN